jgi:AcrR family transcriptional regulator
MDLDNRRMTVGGSASRTRVVQARGDRRRAAILKAAIALLNANDAAQITYSDVGRRAGVPLSSMHHFYKDLQAIYFAIVADDNDALSKRLNAPLRAAHLRSWHTIWSEMTNRQVRHLRANPGVSQLLIGGKVTPEFKLQDREIDLKLARIIEAAVNQHFVLPILGSRTHIFFVALEIVDLLFTLSMIDHGTLTAKMVQESKKASVAYLSLYLGADLKRR